MKFNHDGRKLLGMYSWGKVHVFDRATRASEDCGHPMESRSQGLARALVSQRRASSQSQARAGLHPRSQRGSDGSPPPAAASNPQQHDPGPADVSTSHLPTGVATLASSAWLTHRVVPPPPHSAPEVANVGDHVHSRPTNAQAGVAPIFGDPGGLLGGPLPCRRPPTAPRGGHPVSHEQQDGDGGGAGRHDAWV